MLLLRKARPSVGGPLAMAVIASSAALRPLSAGLANGIDLNVCFANAPIQILTNVLRVSHTDVNWPSCHSLPRSVREDSPLSYLNLLRNRGIRECPRCNLAIALIVALHPRRDTLDGRQSLLLARTISNGCRSFGFVPGIQQDVSEFLVKLIPKPYRTDPNYHEWVKQPVRDQFFRRGVRTSLCTACNTERVTEVEEHFFTFHVL